MTAAKRVPYALASLAENPFQFAVAVFYTLWILYAAFDNILTHFSIVHTKDDAAFLAGFTAFMVSAYLYRVRNSSRYVEFLVRLAGSELTRRQVESLALRLPNYRAHAKAIERIGNRRTMQHFDAMIRIAQLEKNPPPKKTLSFRQIAYGIELGLVHQYEHLPQSEVRAPFASYRDQYDATFLGKEATSEAWADFMLRTYDGLSLEVKTQAESKTEFSFMERVEKHIGFWTVFLAIAAIVISVLTTVIG